MLAAGNFLPQLCRFHRIGELRLLACPNHALAQLDVQIMTTEKYLGLLVSEVSACLRRGLMRAVRGARNVFECTS
eukprot:COSAG02_NODE_572_length_20163_cov_9.875461_17_plen_75_part_00